MKKILFYQPGFLRGELFSPEYAYTLIDPFIFLSQELRKKGYLLATMDQFPLSEAEWLVFMDAHSVIKNGQETDFYKESVALGLRSKLVLFLHESKAVIPENYSPSLHARFNLILTLDDDLVDNKKFFKVYHAYQRHRKPIKRVPYSHKKLLANMSVNKSSSVPGQLYTARFKTIDYFDKYYSEVFDLYGDNWNQPRTVLEKYLPILTKKFSSYKGKVAKYAKEETLSHYKFTLCYENIATVNGYITEKIFDCFWSGTVPIYLGAPNISNYVDKNTFIDRRKFKSDAHLANYLLSMSAQDYNHHLPAAKRYLASPKFKLFLPANFVTRFSEILKL